MTTDPRVPGQMAHGGRILDRRPLEPGERLSSAAIVVHAFRAAIARPGGAEELGHTMRDLARDRDGDYNADIVILAVPPGKGMAVEDYIRNGLGLDPRATRRRA